MKKRFIIPVISFCSAFMTISAQENSQSNLAEKKYTCFVKIETIAGEYFEAAFDRFTADSVFLAPVEENHIKAGGKYIKILKEETDTAIAVSRIKNFAIAYEPDIIYRADLKNKIKELKRKNAGRITGMVLSGIITSPAMLFGDLPVIIDSRDFEGLGKRKTSVTGSSLYVSRKFKTFTLDGDNEQYVNMVKRLTKIKTSPFENSIAKN